jgi:S-formylglutathione hydrolase FrmB
MSRHCSKRGLLALALGILSCVTATLATGPASPAGGNTTPHDRSGLVNFAGLRVLQVNQIDSRLMDVTLSTNALSSPVHVEVLVPSNYSTEPTQRYPSIYLLHGCDASNSPSGPLNGLDYLGWTEDGLVEQTTAHTEAIVVIPEGGSAASSTDWFNNGAGGPPEWETFQVGQLVPWVDHNFHTMDSRGERAIAGLSMGGFGAMSYASRHPDLFGAAASFSGADDLTYPPDATEPISTVVVAACAEGEGGSEFSTFGSHTTEELNWRAHDPPQLAVNLKHTKLYLYTGNGQPGPLDPPGTTVDEIEVLAQQSTVDFHNVLESMGIHSFYDDYGPGTHTFPYWARDFRDVLPKFMADFARNALPPATFAYTTDADSYSIYGWGVRMHRTAAEFSTLDVLGARGFTLSGSGSATVVTGPDYQPLSSQVVEIRSGSEKRTESSRADGVGRLRIVVPLGPANPFQEYSATAIQAGTHVFTTQVEVR